jgi:type VI secretion system protein ImpH
MIEDLQATPGKFAFVQAVHIAERYLRQQGLPGGRENCRFLVNPSLAFPPADIESLTFAIPEEGPARTDMMLNLLGLHGADSPLPAYFTEHVAKNRDDPDPLRDFFDIFNHRIIAILFATWSKYRYYAQYETGACDPLSQRFFGFIGAGFPETRMAKPIQWPRLMAYMGLIALNGEATGSLENILRHYFRHGEIHIIPCVRRWVHIPEDQQTRLSVRNDTLWEDFILGDEVLDQTGKFRIRIDRLDWEGFLSFLPCNGKFNELKAVVDFVLRSRFSFDVELRLKPGEIRPWLQGDDANGTLLGWSTWCGTDGEGIVVLETDYGEL